MTTEKSPKKNEVEEKGLFAFFFLKPTFAILLVFMMVFGGFLAYNSMVKESMPDLEIPQATVTVEWPGADPESVELEMTNKIETKLKGLKGLKRLRSASLNSYAIMAVEFHADVSMSDAMQRLRAKVDEAEADLPKEAKKPKIVQVSVDDTPILTISIFGKLDDAIIGNAAKNLKTNLEKVQGVNEVKISGRREEVIQIRIMPSKADALGLSSVDIRNKIQDANLDMPWDKFESKSIGATFRLFGRFRDVETLKKMPVARVGQGRVVRLEEVAEVKRDLEKETNVAELSWKGSSFERCIDISITKIPGGDTLEIINNITKGLEKAKQSEEWPFGMKSEITADQSIRIWKKLKTVFKNGVQATICVFIVLFFVLSWREALVAGFAIPITFLGSIAVLWMMGNTLNEMVIIGMILSLGLLVDVFILMMEGMHEGIFGRNESFGKAALNTVKTYAVPALSGQLTTILAMAPLLVIAGIDGKFIRILPITTITCLFLSFIVALIVTIPMSRFLLGNLKGKTKKSAIDKFSEKSSAVLNNWMLTTTVGSRGKSISWIAGAIGLLIASFVLASTLPSLLYPKQDGRNLGVTIELPPNTVLERSEECAERVGNLLRSIREKDGVLSIGDKTFSDGNELFESVVLFAGKKSPMSQNSIAEMLTPAQDTYLVGFSCHFIDEKDRGKLAFQYLKEIRSHIEKELRHFSGARLVMTPQVGGSSTEDPVQIEIIGPDMAKLREMVKEVSVELAKVEGATDVRDNLGPARLNIKAIPDREALDFYKVSTSDLAYQVRYAMTSNEIGKYPLGGSEDDIKIKLSTAWPSREGEVGGPTNIFEMDILSVMKPNGKSIPLSSLTHPEIEKAPLAITRKGGERAVTVMCKTQGRTTGEILDDMRPVLDKMKKKWPKGYSFHFAGEAEAAAETFGSAGKMMLVALFLVFALLVIQFNSYTQPFIIMVSVPLAFIGACFGFALTETPFSFPAMIGAIALVGIVVNNAIVMIDAMNTYHKEGMSIKEAAAKGSSDRLRPILATTVTTVVGLIPLALSPPGWAPLCNMIIFGLIAATFTSLIIVPCLYVLLAKDIRTSGN